MLRSRLAALSLSSAFVLAAFLMGLAAPARAADPEPLLMTYILSNCDYWDLDVAVQKGFFADEGFKPDYISNSGSVQSTQLLLTNTAQLAVTQPEALIAAIVAGGKGVGAIASPMKRVDWMVVGQNNIHSLADLKGKSIGFSGLRITEFWLTQDVLKKAGLGEKDYDSLQIGTTPAKYAALTNGSIAATILFQPMASEATQNGFTRLSDLGENAGYIPNLYIVSREWASTNNHGVRLTRALSRAHAWLYDPANKAEAIDMMVKLSKTSEKAVSEAYDLFFQSKKWYTDKGEIDTNAVTTAVKTVIDHGVIDKASAPSLDDIILPANLGGLRQ
jgi:ABC-type nitrate/sulfonate/bicarbonate transport system substrate-binding protein